jgi:hypothetical protein
MIVGASCTFNVTKHPTSGCIIQQLREAFPFEAPQKYLIFDRIGTRQGAQVLSQSSRQH